VPPRIVRIRDLSSPGPLDELVAESERAGLRLVRRLESDWHSGANRFDQPGEALFGALVSGRLVGVCGLNIDPHSAAPRVGRVRHLYVLAAERRQGLGTRLVQEVVATARGSFDRLHLRTNDPLAARFYERLGLERCETEPSATHVLDMARRWP
jgi:GNAT superfamily N-acetyltransferase